jgi:putative transcriptional regulator
LNQLLIDLRGKQSRALIAVKLGITPQGLGMIERGVRTPRPKLMEKFAEFYGKSVGELFFGGKETKRVNKIKKENSI